MHTTPDLRRRDFLRYVAGTAAVGVLTQSCAADSQAAPPKRPNVVFLLADQWRAQATGYAGDENASTPHLDAMAGESVNFVNAVSGCPVCCPYRGSLLTGQFPLSHGVFLNDVYLSSDAVTLAECFNEAGYQTGYIGKWHLDGHGRSAYIPPERRQGFQFWRGAECTHNYNRSHYYSDTAEKLFWDGYDAIAQTDEAERYIRGHQNEDQPFMLMVSWGPPHNPYETAPEAYQTLAPEDVKLRPNVPSEREAASRKDLAGYYAHVAALDACVGRVVETLEACGLADDTILVFTSDHGDMIGSQGEIRKQKPWDESIRVPFLVRYPRRIGTDGSERIRPIDTPDIMPTLLSLCGIDAPSTIEGTDRTDVLLGTEPDGDEAALITCPSPFGEWQRSRGGREYRGVRTSRYTYVRSLEGPWLLFDNEKDPYQMNNLVNNPKHADLQDRLERMLAQRLAETGDQFLPGQEYIDKWGYEIGPNGTVPYTI